MTTYATRKALLAQTKPLLTQEMVAYMEDPTGFSAAHLYPNTQLTDVTTPVKHPGRKIAAVVEDYYQHLIRTGVETGLLMEGIEFNFTTCRSKKYIAPKDGMQTMFDALQTARYVSLCVTAWNLFEASQQPGVNPAVARGLVNAGAHLYRVASPYGSIPKATREHINGLRKSIRIGVPSSSPETGPTN